MFLNVSKFSAVLLASFVAASPLYVELRGSGDTVVIGYRTVSKAEAEFYDDNLKPMRDPAFDTDPSNRGHQTGNGVYTSPNPGEWYSAAFPDPRYCYILAGSDKFDAAQKIWIPQDMWGKPEQDIAGYVRSKGLDPDRALRLSIIDTHQDKVQMMIPSKFANNDDIGLFVDCAETVSGLLVKDGIDYGKWKNVSGSKDEGKGKGEEEEEEKEEEKEKEKEKEKEEEEEKEKDDDDDDSESDEEDD